MIAFIIKRVYVSGIYINIKMSDYVTSCHYIYYISFRRKYVQYVYNNAHNIFVILLLHNNNDVVILKKQHVFIINYTRQTLTSLINIILVLVYVIFGIIFYYIKQFVNQK